MTPEGKVKYKVREILKGYHVHYNHIPASQFGKAGAADYIACVSGRYLAIECKAGKGKQTELQKEEARNITKSGGYYVVIDEGRIEAFVALVEAILQNPDIELYISPNLGEI